LGLLPFSMAVSLSSCAHRAAASLRGIRKIHYRSIPRQYRTRPLHGRPVDLRSGIELYTPPLT
jgi:hypothetical protein